MLDFIISVIISLIVNTKIVPCLDIIRNYYAQNGSDFTTSYYIILAVSYIVIGAIAYALIQGIKYILKKIDL